MARAEVTVAERDDKPVTLTLPLAAAAPDSVATSPPPDSAPAPAAAPQSHTARTIAIAGFATAGVGIVVGSITGLLSIAKTSSVKVKCDGN